MTEAASPSGPQPGCPLRSMTIRSGCCGSIIPGHNSMGFRFVISAIPEWTLQSTPKVSFPSLGISVMPARMTRISCLATPIRSGPRGRMSFDSLTRESRWIGRFHPTPLRLPRHCHVSIFLPSQAPDSTDLFRSSDLRTTGCSRKHSRNSWGDILSGTALNFFGNWPTNLEQDSLDEEYLRTLPRPAIRLLPISWMTTVGPPEPPGVISVTPSTIPIHFVNLTFSKTLGGQSHR